MYPTKTTGFLGLLMNALALPKTRRTRVARRRAVLPRRREAAVVRSIPDAVATKEMYFETARLTRWTR